MLVSLTIPSAERAVHDRVYGISGVILLPSSVHFEAYPECAEGSQRGKNCSSQSCNMKVDRNK